MTEQSREWPDHTIPGKNYRLREAEFAVRKNVSPSFLQKDRLKEQPIFDFARYGRSVRYPDE